MILDDRIKIQECLVKRISFKAIKKGQKVEPQFQGKYHKDENLSREIKKRSDRPPNSVFYQTLFTNALKNAV